ncbi:kinesin family member C1 [Blastomyces dermatitidis ER-3]|uniref:Kinesin-like protein n=3 Tax=Blastomyces TaxID=229219 RepID=A0A179USB6_BLAGS|nr:kinesin family member C1 [Blastomyces gilchristii SLH14081]XP_045274699.1 kinesin family member C1 [Blastomyces dermatitidis ER-3]EGE78053.2 kinesin family member C1 [Blastomyces dermatitidis ATCC 18188]EQL38354.1 kinesin family member C1 [Blastomyces dermatitidis ATCC 26199]EEQ87365.2 kinesin family member C1 [Blastomyces dermatitidis ER-3]OAT10088.1 kinesin family member C1 [Blastomyces gilchristii SLH14081]
MDGDENAHRFSSGIPRLNRANPNGRSLHDITVSANNSAAGTMMPPLGTTSRKHVESITTQPAAPARKTLAERGGETRKQNRFGHSASKSMSSKPLYSASTSTSSRPASAASRNNPYNPKSSSNGPSSRTRSSTRNIARPQTSFGYRCSHGASSPRPITSMSTRDDDLHDSVLGKRKVEAWDQDAKMEKMNAMCDLLLNRFQGTTNQSAGLKEAIELYKSRLQEVEEKNSQLSEHNITLRVELDTTKSRLLSVEKSLKDASRDHEIAIDDLDRQHRIDLETSRQEARNQIEELVARHKEELRELRRRFDNEVENERSKLRQELNQMNAQTSMDIQRTQIEVENKDRELRDVTAKVDSLTSDLNRERALNKELQQNLVQHSSNIMTLESSISALKARIEFLESGNKEQSDAFGRLDQELRDALAETQATKDKLRKEETLRRKLHNQIQELKGNIRVFCRVRPMLDNEPVEDSARIEFPDSEADSKEISVLGPEEKSSLGNITTKNYAYSFDHVFGPSSQNTDVFEEISQLVQSALDGYNVCIFCYGQTGSGKTHTMSSDDGMIPRAVHQIYDTASALEEKGWQYTMQGNFVEVYNENLNDLLGKAEEFDKKKHEIRHDMQKCKTTITDITTVDLDSPARVESILRRAAMNRSVAATKANERSSRSHSVFILKLIGENRLTGERSEGTLNLVDLAGSERLSHSKATGERLKETQSINRSLSCLGDVIGALGQGKEGGHIPYRNSKLTYLLQFSLGGNSKTLMFVMVSPRQEHLSETLTSLKFATKVHNTHIGTAKKHTKMIRET